MMKFASAPLTTTSAPPEQPFKSGGISRRRFETMLAAGAACLALPRAAVANPPSPQWIDAHVHVWTPDTKRYPLAKPFKVSDMQPPSFTAEQLFAHSRPAGVGRIVLIQMSFYGYDNSYMLDTMAAHPGTFSGVAIVDPQAANVAQQIRELAARGVRGLRIHPGPQQAAGWPQDEAMAKVWKAAGDLGVAICLLINPSDLPHAEAMCEKFPGVRVVIDHFARVGMSGQIENQPLETLCRLSRFPDVYVKTSAFYALGKKQPPYLDLIPMIRRLIDAYGAQRLMWASDCPYQVQGVHTYEDSIALIRDRIDFLSDKDKQSLLRGTAEHVFFSTR